jgi:two-component system OmpR family response regulator
MAERRETGTVLVLDDDPDIAATVVELLVLAGHRVHSVARGDHALEALRGGEICLVLMDWELDAEPMGVDLVRAIKRERQKVPLIVMSADSAALVLAGAAGADDYLPKPLDVDDLLTLVDELAA